MKKFLILFFVFTLFYSCSDDNKDESHSTESIVGVWRSDFEDGYQILTLEKNGKYSLVEFDFVSGNWSETGTYIVKDNLLTVYLDKHINEVYTILSITSKKLVLRYEGKYVGEYDYYYDDDYSDWVRVD